MSTAEVPPLAMASGGAGGVTPPVGATMLAPPPFSLIYPSSVQLTVVQTQLFHNRQPETVEQFIRDLRRMFNRAYAQATRPVKDHRPRRWDRPASQSVRSGVAPRAQEEAERC